MKSIVTSQGTTGATGRNAQSLREEVRHLWSRLQIGLPEGGPQVRIGFCATHRGEGTTSIAANFSIFLAEQGHKTCIVEANLRSPTMAGHFQIPPSPGLSEFVDGTSELQESIRRNVVPLLDVVPAGSPPADVYAPFGDGGIRHVLDALRNQAEVLVLDVPPISAAPESAPILQAMDAVILVVQAHRTRRQAVEKSIATFEELGVPFSGIVLNRVSYDLPPLVEQIL